MHSLMNLLQTLEASLVADQVMHSLLADALKQAEVAALPAAERLSKVALQHLHHKVAAAGYIRRALSGEATPQVRAALVHHLKQVHQHYETVRDSLRALIKHETAREAAPVAAMRQVFNHVAQGQRAVLTLGQAALGGADINVGTLSADEWTL